MYVDHVYQTAMITVVFRVLFLQPFTLHLEIAIVILGWEFMEGIEKKGNIVN